MASTSSTRRSVVVSMLVANGATSAMCSSRRVICSTRIGNGRLELAPGRQLVSAARGRSADAQGRVPPGKLFAESGPNCGLQCLHLRQVARFPIVERRRDVDRARKLGRGQFSAKRREHPWRIKIPLGDQAIGCQSAVQGAAGDPVKVRQIAPGNRAQPVQIEVRIAHLKRIERPLDQTDPAAQGLFPLKELEHSADAAVAIPSNHTGHVGVQIHGAFPQTGHGERKAHQTVTVKRAQYLPAGVLGHHKNRVRHDFQISFAPNLALQGHASAKLSKSLTSTHCELTVHLFPAGSAGALPCSAAFARSHSDSISSRGTSASLRPDARTTRSIARNREENFAFVRFSAISGSTFRKRAKFTAANSTSPTSSSTCRAVPLERAWPSSTSSSRSFRTTPSTSAQSNPMREARRVNWKPSITAGSVCGIPSSKEATSFSPETAALPFRAPFARRSSALICSQLFRTSVASRALFTPKTCGWRRTIF